MSRVIEADHERVWIALTDAGQLTAWDERVIAPVDEAEGYPFSGQHMRWRYRLGSVNVVMHDRPLEIVPKSKLKRRVRMGSLHYEQTFTLQAVPDTPHHTLLGIKVVASNVIPVVGDTIDRFDARRLATEYVDETLRQLQGYCEADPTS